MLSLSNYLTNRRETALISAYCFSPAESEHRLGVFLENHGAGGAVGGGPRRPRLPAQGEQQRCCSETSQTLETHTSVRAPPSPPATTPPSGTLSVSYGSLNACLPSEWKWGYWLASSQRLKRKTIHSSVFSLFFTWKMFSRSAASWLNALL